MKYNQTKLSLENLIIVLDLDKFSSVRITYNETKILLFINDKQKISIQIYDNQFKNEKTFDSLINKQLP
ncbi:unnamed protein product, partial [Rotaria sp. Silwood1]